MNDYPGLREEANKLAQRLSVDDTSMCARVVDRLLDLYTSAQDKDFLVIHNPGGWGTTRLEHSLQWERSIVEGIAATVKKLGYSLVLKQYFRSGKGWLEIMRDMREQFSFFVNKAKVMAAELEFITQHISNLKVVLIGVSQGAAFSNVVLQNSPKLDRVYSIELGLPFPYRSRRAVTERTLAVDSNGLMPDALMEWDVPTIVRTYFTAPSRWVKYRLQGKPRKFSYCINVPGHDYNWEYPEVQRQVEDFLNLKFGTKSSVEVRLP